VRENGLIRDPLAQEWFFREIQRAFREGVSQEVLLRVLSRYAVIGSLIIAGFALWRYREVLSFHLLRIWNSWRHGKIRKRIAAHLIGNKLEVGLYLAGGRTRQYLGTGVITAFGSGSVNIYITSEMPASLRRMLPRRKIYCFFRPFRAAGKRVNSFSTYIQRVVLAEGRVRAIRAYVPDDFTSVPRRKHVRLRIRNSKAVRVKLWSENKKSRFWVTAPDFETMDDAETASWKATARVLDISPGGIKVQIRPQRTSPGFRVSEEVVLDLLILDKANKSFNSFLLLGVVRNIMRPGGGLVSLGIQFRALGERVASRSVDWQLVGDEVVPLQQLLERMRVKADAPSDASR
jgi:hypothetical protein